MENEIELGAEYRDRITGFRGVAMGYLQYLTGCNQALLAPKVTKEGSKRESEWFDVQRVERVGKGIIKLNNGITPGFDKEGPKK